MLYTETIILTVGIVFFVCAVRVG